MRRENPAPGSAYASAPSSDGRNTREISVPEAGEAPVFLRRLFRADRQTPGRCYMLSAVDAASTTDNVFRLSAAINCTLHEPSCGSTKRPENFPVFVLLPKNVFGSDSVALFKSRL